MDIAALSMDLAMMNTQNQVGLKVLDTAMETKESLAAGMMNMMDAAALENSVSPNLGSNIDIRI